MKKQTRTDLKKLIIVLIEFALMVAVAYALICGLESIAFSEDAPVQAYVVCQPGDYVNARMSPSRKSTSVGRYESCDTVWLDGEEKSGFAHCVDTTFETCECWVYGGYIIYDEPEWMDGRTATVVSNGRLAARRNCTGSVRKWLNNGTEIQVYWLSDEWCVTDEGFVMTEYIELDGE